MLTETATVIGLTNNSVQVNTQRKTTCSGCSMKSGCGQYLLGKEDSVLELSGSTVYSAANIPALSVGDQLQLGLEPSQLLVLTWWFYVLPLGSLLLATLLSALAGLSEPVVVFFAFAGLLLGFLAARLMMQTEKVRTRIMPTLAKVG